MSNPYLKLGDQIEGFSGNDFSQRNIVTTLSFNNNDLAIINSKDIELENLNGNQTLLVEPIYKSEEGDDKEQIENSIKHIPPFISTDAWDSEDHGILYNGSFSVLTNGVLTPALLVPNRPEFINNSMKEKNKSDGVVYPGTPTSLGNSIWKWRARLVDKIVEEEKPTKYKYEEELNTKHFSTIEAGKEKYENPLKIFAQTRDRQKMTEVYVPPYPKRTSKNEGICLELPVNEFSEFDDDGTWSGAKLGSFMLLMSLKQDEKTEGKDISETSPWEVKIRMGESLDPSDSSSSDNLEKSSYIVVQMVKNKSISISVYGEKTEFNIPSPPVASTSQGAGGEDSNTIAMTFIPVFNGINVSVGNWNGLDKKVSGRMSKFCICHPPLNIESLYSGSVNPYWPNGDPDASWEDDSFGGGTKVGPSIGVIVENDPGSCRKGLINMGDMLSIDMFNVTGSVSYVPLFFQPFSRAIFTYPVGNDIKGNDDLGFIFWPLWCKNGANAGIKKEKASIANFSYQGVSAVVGSYSRSSNSNGAGISTATIIGVNPFVAGDSVKFTNLPGDISAPSVKLTLSGSGFVQWEDENTDFHSQTANGCKGELLSNRKGTFLKYPFSIQTGRSEEYDIKEDDPNSTIRFDAQLKRFNKSYYSRYPVLMYGTFLVRQENIDLSLIHNNNTPMFNLDVLDPRTQPSSSHDWINCITNIQISHTIDACSGSMTLDRYALTQLYGKSSDFGKQQIGQVSLAMKMGRSGIDLVGSDKNGYRLGGSSDSDIGTFFKGFAYGFGENTSSDSHTLTVPLYGIDKKLNEMVLINSPFFDGEPLERAVNFFCAWGNVDVDMSYAEENNKISAGSVLGQVRHEFKLGTPLWAALQEVAEDTAHNLIVQPDAKVYLYKFNRFGEPEHKNFTPKVWKYPNARVINTSRNPDYSQFFNKLIVVALQGGGSARTKGDENPLDRAELKDLSIFPIAAGADFTQFSSPHIPWEKISVTPLDSYWTQSALANYARILAKQMMQIYYTGTVTIPGNLGVKLYDKLDVNVNNHNFSYWIMGISHNYDATTKSFTTDLSLQALKSSVDFTYDQDGNPIGAYPSGPIEPYDP